MRIRPGRRHTTEDSLRSLGAVLDAVRARGVIIRELRSGLLVRAQVAATLQDRLDGVWRPIDRLVSRGEMARYRREALARRGTGHVAGPHERSLRMIGRHIEERGLVGMTIIQHGTEGSWLLWSAGPDEASATLAVLDDHELHFRDAAEAVRREAATGRPGDTTAHVGHL
ncbi:MAG: hypothetical protein KF809_18035 [Chloroflexi bacterium]|nr:hypothetical protein [Chloroflexota bacterium]